MDERTPSEHKPGAGAVERARRFLNERMAALRKFLTQPADVPGSPAAILADARRGLNKIMAGAAVAASELKSELEKSRVRQAEAPVSASSSSAVTETALASIMEARQRIRPEFSPGGIIGLIPSIVIFLLVVGLVVGALFALNFARYFMTRGLSPF